SPNTEAPLREALCHDWRRLQLDRRPADDSASPNTAAPLREALCHDWRRRQLDRRPADDNAPTAAAPPHEAYSRTSSGSPALPHRDATAAPPRARSDFTSAAPYRNATAAPP